MNPVAAAWRDPESPYTLLGVASSASGAEIRTAYQRVVRCMSLGACVAVCVRPGGVSETPCTGVGVPPRPARRRRQPLSPLPGGVGVSQGAHSAGWPRSTRRVSDSSGKQDPEQRTAYDAGLAAREHTPALDVDLDDLRVAPCDAGGGSTRAYVHSCRCGSLVTVAEADLLEDASCVEFACATCSLRLRVHYASVS